MHWGYTAAESWRARLHQETPGIAPIEKAELSTHVPLFLEGTRSVSAGSLFAAAGETSHPLVIKQQSGANWPCEWKRRPLQRHLLPKIFTCNLAFSPIPGQNLSIWTAGTCFIALFVSNRDPRPCLAFLGGAVWFGFLVFMAGVSLCCFIFAVFIEYVLKILFHLACLFPFYL